MSDWLEKRLPLRAFCRQHLCEYQAPKNLNFWYLFGVFSLVVLANQMITGIWLVMHYTPTAKEAFASIEHMMRYVPLVGCFATCMRSVLLLFCGGVSAYVSWSIVWLLSKPRELVWLIGCVMFIVNGGSFYRLCYPGGKCLIGPRKWWCLYFQ